MPTAKPDWTAERPDEPGFYWWMQKGRAPLIVDLKYDPDDHPEWVWYGTNGFDYDDTSIVAAGALWWPVRLDPPPVG